MIGIIVLVVLLLLLIYAIATNPVLLVALILFVVLGSIQTYVDSKKKKEDDRKAFEEKERQRLDAQAIELFQACLKRGLNPPLSELPFDATAYVMSHPDSSEYSGDAQLRAAADGYVPDTDDGRLIALVAKSTGAGESLEEALKAFRHGCYLAEMGRRRGLIEEVKTERSKEEEQVERQKELSRLVGKEKYLHGLRLELEKARKSKQDWDRITRSMVNSSHAPADTSDWASAGGFASAIAGPAAGLAVASDIQRRNAEAEAAKARERANLNSALAYPSMMSVKSAELIKKAEEIFTGIRKLVIDDSDEEAKMGLIKTQVHSQKTTKFGNLCVRMTACWKERPKLFGQPASLDGTLSVVALKDGKAIGGGYYVAPGIDEFDMDKVGFNPDGPAQDVLLKPSPGKRFEEGEAYEIKLFPAHLWLIEVPKDEDWVDIVRGDEG